MACMKAWAKLCLVTSPAIQESFLKGREMDMGSTCGMMGRSSRDIGKTASLMDLGSILIAMGTALKEDGRKIGWTAMESLFGKMEESIREIIIMGKNTGTGKCIGMMGSIGGGTGKMAKCMERLSFGIVGKNGLEFGMMASLLRFVKKVFLRIRA